MVCLPMPDLNWRLTHWIIPTDCGHVVLWWRYVPFLPKGVCTSRGCGKFVTFQTTALGRRKITRVAIDLVIIRSETHSESYPSKNDDKILVESKIIVLYNRLLSIISSIVDD